MARKRSDSVDSIMPLITMSFTQPATLEKMSLTWAVLDGQHEASDWIGLFRGEEKVVHHKICFKSEKKGGTVCKLLEEM
jgi:hypothetical protein